MEIEGDVMSFKHDRAMSLHRRAYEVMQNNGDYKEWVELAVKLECPNDAIYQIWKTTKLAFEAGMKAEFAFPLSNS